jgi:hypothetical protein
VPRQAQGHSFSHSTRSKTSSSSSQDILSASFETQVHLKAHLKGVSLSKKKHSSIIRRIVSFNTRRLAYESDFDTFIVGLPASVPGDPGVQGLYLSTDHLWRNHRSKSTNTRRRSSQVLNELEWRWGPRVSSGSWETRD